MIAIAQTGAFPPTGYGAAPGCNGLSPAQTNSIYSAPGPAHGAGARASPSAYSSCPPTSPATSGSTPASSSAPPITRR